MAESSNAPCARPVAVVGPQYCAPYPIDLAIVRNPKTLADGNFAVTDVNGNLTFKVKETRFLERRNILDAAGNPVVTLRHKAMSAHSRWEVFRGESNELILDAARNPIVTLRSRKAMNLHSRWQVFRGESTDPQDLIFNAKTHSIFITKTKLDVFLASNTAEKVCDFRLKGSFTDRSCVVYAGDEDSKTIVAEMHKQHTAKSILLGKDSFMVTVYPKIDYAFIVALILILDAINQEAKFVAANATT